MTERESAGSVNPKRRRAALLGLAFVLALVLAGLLLARELHGISELQDCAMSGRSNCAPVDAGAGN